ncbi:TetR/AcrR family transcriptional regulator [Arthrobacter sp. B2a2-09]|uniref:TetR/AcrR family transcriptional regulator n=1 Tax=Arthrobacter sp. B2a2-09 TaxID=2952822 RepID=UPI0022CD6652|nr:TetR/AcrR family transcriptional regulator [Arthrobacter sp. B2a2-09]MCZ9882837.1 TetR/AcrR family transcriptional regulator [Arthrobacter sp. B2a2-09]
MTTSIERSDSTGASPAGETVRQRRGSRVNATRERILSTAERLFAEYGIGAVSNRLVSDEAGQGNNAAVGYHFGTKVDLVRAIARRHNVEIEERRKQLIAGTRDSSEILDWVACLVRPVTDHLDSLPAPTWFARFGAQLMTDPGYRQVMEQDAMETPALRELLAGLDRCLPDLPAEVRAERDDMARQLLVHTLSERERALAEGRPTTRSSWHDAGTGVIDAITGLWLAPYTPAGPDRPADPGETMNND